MVSSPAAPVEHEVADMVNRLLSWADLFCDPL